MSIFLYFRNQIYMCSVMIHGMRLLFAVLMMGATAAMAQPAQQDMDAKYATGLVKAGTAAPDFKMKTPEGKTIQLSKFAKGKTVVLDSRGQDHSTVKVRQGKDCGARLLGIVVSRLSQGCPRGGSYV